MRRGSITAPARLRTRGLALVLALAPAVVLAPLPGAADRVPGTCFSHRSSGPIAVSCRLTFQGNFVRGFTASTPEGGVATTQLDIALDDDPSVVLASCSFDGTLLNGRVPSPIGVCSVGTGRINLPSGTQIRCTSRGTGVGVFGCVSR